VAVPIFEQIIQAVWSGVAPRTPLDGPSPEARRQLIDLPIDPASGDRLSYRTARAFVEHFHLTRAGQLDDTQYRLVSQDTAYGYRDGQGLGEVPQAWNQYESNPYGNRYPYGQSPYRRVVPQQQPPQQSQPWRGWFGSPWGWGNDDRQPPRRVDPDYPRSPRGIY